MASLNRTTSRRSTAPLCAYGPKDGRAERAKFREHRAERKRVFDAIIRVKPAAVLHGVGGAVTLRFERLFIARLRGTHVADDRGQDVIGVIAQLLLRHVGARRHERSGECGEFAG
jgi:hypothetical protein